MTEQELIDKAQAYLPEKRWLLGHIWGRDNWKADWWRDAFAAVISERDAMAAKLAESVDAHCSLLLAIRKLMILWHSGQDLTNALVDLDAHGNLDKSIDAGKAMLAKLEAAEKLADFVDTFLNDGLVRDTTDDDVRGLGAALAAYNAAKGTN